MVNQEAAQFVAENAKHQDLTLSWFIPDTVRLERRYQMLARAQELLPAIQRMERLLSVNLAITNDILVDRVDAHIAKQLVELGINPNNSRVSEFP